MILTVALITLLPSGDVVERDTFTANDTTVSINDAWQDCKKEERMIAPCMLRQEREDGSTVYTNLENWYQLIIPAKG